jgi:translation elongation factor EF-1alpha
MLCSASKLLVIPELSVVFCGRVEAGLQKNVKINIGTTQKDGEKRNTEFSTTERSLWEVEIS